MLYKKIYPVVAALLLACSPLFWRGVGGEAFAQQDAQYSLYMFNHLALNPAYAGTRDAFSTALTYRNQWTNMEGAPSTAALSSQLPLRQGKIGLGAEIFSDKLGPRSTNAVLFSYSYRIPLLTGKLAFGLRMGMFNYIYDFDKMDFKDQGDIYDSPTNSSKLTGTGDFGLYYYSRTFYWGFSGMHMNRGRMSDFAADSTRQVRHYFMTVGKSFKVGNTIINPILLVKSADNAPVTSDIGLNILLKEKWWLGVSYRSSYGVVFLSQYMINEKLRLGYSYDLGTNAIGRAGGGSHEIMIGYDVNIMGTKAVLPRYL
jgi:type IX secretion system PorP/SprF family membrane protein